MDIKTKVLLKIKKLASDKITGGKVLTDRELEYLVLVAAGFKNKAISKILSVTESTVKKTLEKVFRKLQAKDRANAVTVAFAHDILNVYILNNIIKRYNLDEKV